ncbi:hypothetical protein BKA56DRAFT_593225 [Ilyonectria sp. MPI-CAGE-AT-0026]|nr:hypothetical protein BKA56DRAFT_593225 [Ilyonectria sp. MPI-CAGE-AT-0026]
MTTQTGDAAIAGVGNSGPKLRRRHKKSKTGCLDCRRRRVKCSEEKPECRACCRRGVECQYSSSTDPSPAMQHDETSPASTSTPLSQSQSQSQSQQISPIPNLSSLSFPAILTTPYEQSCVTFGIKDMALFHHWTTRSSLDIFKTSSLSITCQVTFSQVALKHPFVMQALLGLAALHIAYLDPRERLRHTADAARYHNQGLEGFREAVTRDNEEAGDALFVWSTLNLFYVFGVSGRLGEGLCDESGWGSRRDRILGLGWIPMILGVETVLEPFSETIGSGPLRDVVNIGIFDDLDPDEATDPEDQRFCYMRTAWENNPDASTYEGTLQALRRCRMYMAQFSTMDGEDARTLRFNRSWQGAFIFVPVAPKEYFTLLHQRQPPALILYAFYGALLHSLNESWFMEGWGYDIVEVVDDLLGSYWKSWIAWPLEVVGLQNTSQ